MQVSYHDRNQLNHGTRPDQNRFEPNIFQSIQKKYFKFPPNRFFLFELDSMIEIINQKSKYQLQRRLNISLLSTKAGPLFGRKNGGNRQSQLW